jgi:predicted nuclease with TOPRIM domain
MQVDEEANQTPNQTRGDRAGKSRPTCVSESTSVIPERCCTRCDFLEHRVAETVMKLTAQGEKLVRLEKLLEDQKIFFTSHLAHRAENFQAHFQSISEQLEQVEEHLGYLTDEVRKFRAAHGEQRTQTEEMQQGLERFKNTVVSAVHRTLNEALLVL